MKTVVEPTKIVVNPFEHAISCPRPDERVEMVLVHIPGSEPQLGIASYPLKDNPNAEPSQEFSFSMEEAAALFDLLNHPEVKAYFGR